MPSPLRKDAGGSSVQTERAFHPERMTPFIAAAQVLTALVGITAIVVIFGWFAGNAWSKSLYPGLPSMKFNTAFSLFLLGASIGALSLPACHFPLIRRIGRGVALVPFILSVASIAEYAFGVGLGVDELFVSDEETRAAGGFPGRMSPATSTSILLLSLAALSGMRSTLARVIALIAAEIGTIALGFFIIGAEGAPHTGFFSTMAVHTACLVLLLGVSATLLPSAPSVNRSHEISPTLAPIAWACAGIALPSMTLAVVAFLVPHGESWHQALPFLAAVQSCVLGLVSAALIWSLSWRLSADIGAATLAMERAEQNFEAIRETLFELSIVSVADASGKIIDCNDAFCQISGYSREELLGQDHRIINSGRHPKAFWVDVWRRIASGKPWRGDVCNRAKDGSLYWVDSIIAPFKGADGKINRYVSIRNDITARKHFESEVISANEALTIRNRELDEFTYVASHDLQEPLRKLISFSKLLSMDIGGDLPENAANDLKFITDAAARMQTLVQDLLELSRAGRRDLNMGPVDLNDCVDRALYALASRVEETRARIEKANLPMVTGNATMLTQLYQNLIGNALKYMRSGQTPEIQLTAEKIDNHWLLGVRDNGLGIKTEYLEVIFAPFKRLHGRNQYEGTGIGLSICRKVVERHGGRIWAESEHEQGTHFKFTLPLHQEIRPWTSESANPPSYSSSTTILATRN